MKRIISLFIVLMFMVILTVSCDYHLENIGSTMYSNTASEITKFQAETTTAEQAETTTAEQAETTTAEQAETTTAEQTETTSMEEPIVNPKIVELGLIEINPNESLMELISETIISEEDFAVFVYSKEGVKDMYAVAEKYGIKYYKSHENLYLFLIRTDEGYLQIMFHKGGKNDGKLHETYLIDFSDDSVKEKMEKLEVGMNRDDVMEADRDGFFWSFNYIPSKDTYHLQQYPCNPYCSYHFFSDGTVYEIEYKFAYRIEKITVYYL